MPSAPPRSQPKRGISQATFAWLLIAPAAAFLCIVVLWPLLETVRLSFTDADIGGETYIGTENYEKLWNSRKFSGTISRTFMWMFIGVTAKVIMGLIGASLLNAKLPGRGLFRMLVMPPWVIPVAIGCIGWLWLYNGHFGIISGTLMRIGVLDGPFEFLAYRDSAFISAIVTDQGGPDQGNSWMVLMTEPTRTSPSSLSRS